MAKTVYTYELRRVDCSKCGAPVVCPVEGGPTTCTFCHAPLSVGRRRKDAPVYGVEEKERQAGLRAQAGRPDPSSPFLYVTPDGLAVFETMIDDASTRAAALAGIRQGWEAIRTECERDPDPAETIRLFRTALLLARAHAAKGEHEHARAVLETALDLLPLPGQRDVLRYALASLAVDCNDLDAFGAWMADTDPHPVQLEVDTRRRLAMARFHLKRGEHAQALAALQGPVAADGQALAFLLRAHGHAGAGDTRAARSELEMLAGVLHAGAAVRALVEQNPGPASALVDDALRARTAAAPAALPAGRPKRRGCLAVFISLSTFGCPLVFVFPMVLAPGMFLRACGAGEPLDAALEKANDCPQARQELGDDIDAAIGFGCGEMETGGGSGNVNWSLRVSGSNDDGRLSIHATQWGGSWTLQSAQLETDASVIDLLGCSAGGGAGGSESLPFPPAGPASPITSHLDGRCRDGDAQSCLALGAMYDQGNGVPRDRAAALAFYRKACALGEQGGCVLAEQGGIP